MRLEIALKLEVEGFPVWTGYIGTVKYQDKSMALVQVTYFLVFV